MQRHIFLIGMPGCGKSSLGRKSASYLGLNYVDMDQRIERTFGMSIGQIFQLYGERGFRTAETNMLIQLTREPGAVVSTGGGTVLNPKNLAIMRNHGIIVLIDRPLNQIKQDIKLNRRPMLKAKGLPELERIYNERMPLYRAAADVTLKNAYGYFAGVNGLEKLIQTFFFTPRPPRRSQRYPRRRR